MLKFFIFRGEAFNNELPLLNNIHLDIIMILCIYHVTFLNKVYSAKLADILQVYKDKVLFPMNVQKTSLLSYYKENFKQQLTDHKAHIDLLAIT